MITQRKSAKGRLRLEGLEDRCLLAGDVTAAVVNGTLELTGDDMDNAISVSAALNGSGNPVADSFVVTGLNGTTINGVAGAGGANASMTFGSVEGLSADLGDGGDIFQLTNAELQHNVAVATGADNDQVWIGVFNGQSSGTTGLGAAATGALGTAFNALVPPTLSVDGGQAHIHGNLNVTTGAGDDQVAESNVLVDGNETINTGTGADSVFGMALSDVVDTSAISGDLAGQEHIGVQVDGKLIVDLGTNNGMAGAAVDAVFASSLSANKGIFLNGSQDAQFTLTNNTGGKRGVVINGTVPGNHSDQDEDEDQNENSNNASAMARIERLLAQYEQILDRIMSMLAQNSTSNSLGGLIGSLANGNSNGNGHHWGHHRRG